MITLRVGSVEPEFVRQGHPARPAPSRLIRRGLVALATVALAVGAAACSSSGGSAASSGKTIGIVLPSEPLYLEPCNTHSDVTGWVLRQNVTQTLAFENSASGKLAPELATAWKQLSPATWEFTLRKGVKFQDGSSFGAPDVVHTVERFQNAKLACGAYQQFFNGVKMTAKAVNDSTVDITTDPADPILPLHTADMDIVARNTPMDKQINAPVGTGPYKFVSWQRGSNIVLKRFDDYWGTKPEAAGVKYQWRDNPTVAAGMVKNGEADFAFALNPTSGAGSYAVTYAQSAVTWLRVNMDTPPLNDVRVRLAMRYAIDANALINSVFKGVAQPASQLITESVDGYNPSLKPWPFDLAKAKQLLAQAKAAGVDTSKQILIIGRLDLYANTTQAMEAVQQMLQKAGLNVKLQMLSTDDYVHYQKKPYPTNVGPYMLQALHGNRCGDASCSLPQFFTRGGVSSTGGTAQLDAMIAKASSESGAQRTADFQKAIAFIVNDQARDIYLAQMKATVAVGPHISYTPSAATDLALPVADIKLK